MTYGSSVSGWTNGNENKARQPEECDREVLQPLALTGSVTPWTRFLSWTNSIKPLLETESQGWVKCFSFVETIPTEMSRIKV